MTPVHLVLGIVVVLGASRARRAWLHDSDGRAARDAARRLLGVERGADARAITAAHRRLIASHHPDMGGNAHTAAKINAARDLLIK